MSENMQYKRLSTGYHYVCDLSAYHRFAQWPIDAELTAEHVSHNGCDVEQFIRAAQRVVSHHLSRSMDQ